MSRFNYIYNIISLILFDNVICNEWLGQYEIYKKFSLNYVKCFIGIGIINYVVKRIKNCY